MFQIYPGFEELLLRVEVEWRGCARPVVARLEQWPDSDKAVLVCAFVEDPINSERVLAQGRSFYFVEVPDKLLHKGNRLYARPEFRRQAEEKLQSIVRFAYADNHTNFNLARVLFLPDLPAIPRCIWDAKEGLLWCVDTIELGRKFVRFTHLSEELSLNKQETIETLRNTWNNQDSDIRFAWEWSRLNDADKNQLLMGETGNLRKLEQVMRQVLVATTQLWELHDRWMWKLTPYESSNDGFFYDISSFEEDNVVWSHHWQKFLRLRYAPQWRQDLIERYECAREFYYSSSNFTIGLVEVNHPPTAHEQLEAKLALRDWLANAATPDVAAVLLASLDD